MPNQSDLSLDISFSVPQVHRLRVTQDVACEDAAQLLELIESEGGSPAKVLVIAEQALEDSSDRIERIDRLLRQHPQIHRVGSRMLVEGGESVKNDSVCVNRILAAINEHNLDRRSYVIAIGGGAMLDTVGYATAIAHRGVRLIRLPTTTLAQADSGVGVKNAINHFGKKNWIGTFAVPWAVVNDAGLLSSLSDRDFQSGFSEAVKVTLLKDRSEFEWLCENAGRIRNREMPVATRAIHQSCLFHLRHITEGGDPFEMLEARPLDFGHWSAHKLEPLTDYRLRHGEAVAIGVAIDCLYSVTQHGFPESDAMKACQCLSALGLKLWHPQLEDTDVLLTGLEEFRQHLGGRLTITMLRGVGDLINVHEIDADAMRAAIAQLKEISCQIDPPALCR